jgi:hypothetical protein
MRCRLWLQLWLRLQLQLDATYAASVCNAADTPSKEEASARTK